MFHCVSQYCTTSVHFLVYHLPGLWSCVWARCQFSWTWESGLNSRHSATSETATVFGIVFLSEALSCLSCVSQSLAKPHWLWKNNLTGFNLLPPPLPSLFLLPLFLFFCAPLRLWEFILFSILNNSMPGLSAGFRSTGYRQSFISWMVLCIKPHLGRNRQFGCVCDVWLLFLMYFLMTVQWHTSFCGQVAYKILV